MARRVPRRRVAAVLAVAALAAAGLWWLRADTRPRVPAGLMTQAFTTTAGERQTLEAWRDRPLLLNFWATWCAPCREEMPVLDAFARRATPPAPQVLGIAWDSVENASAFLRETPVRYPVLLGGGEIGGFMKALGNTSGGLPFTVLVSARGELLAARSGAFREDELAAWVQEHSGANGPNMQVSMDNVSSTAANSRP